MADFAIIVDKEKVSYAEVDDAADSRALVTMDTRHNRIHRGQMYEYTEVDAALANAGTIELLLVLTAGAHMRFASVAGGDARVQLYEGTTVSANGTQRTAQNRNRFSSNTPDMAIYFSPTITGDGTLISDGILPGGIGGLFSGGGSSDIFEEWILGPGNYLLRLTNISGGAQPCSVQVDFYEDSDD